jgi:hypothetical protein
MIYDLAVDDLEVAAELELVLGCARRQVAEAQPQQHFSDRVEGAVAQLRLLGGEIHHRRGSLEPDDVLHEGEGFVGKLRIAVGHLALPWPGRGRGD